MPPAGKNNFDCGKHALKPKARSAPHWGTVRIALEIARSGGFQTAAQELGLSLNILRSRVRKLETDLGLTLFVSKGSRLLVTPEGEKIFAVAAKMEAASFELFQLREQGNNEVSGNVRLGITEGLGTFWIAPSLAEFQRAHPNLLVDVICAPKSSQVQGIEADVAIQLERPTARDMSAIKVGRLHFLPYAVAHYLETFGEPKAPADLVNHRILMQTGDYLEWQQLWKRHFGGIPISGWVTQRTDVGSVHYWSIANGGGIGMLPTYAQCINSQLVPLALDMYVAMDIWLSYRSDSSQIPRISLLIDWITQAFSPAQFPWFRDEFIHPKDFKATYQCQAVPSMCS